MTTKVVKGSLWTLAGQIAPLAVSLVTTPFVIRLLGAESYGVLILIDIIPAALSFADLGMNVASTRFGSEAYAEGDLEKEAQVVRTAALIALCGSLPVGAALLFFTAPIVGLFNIPADLQGEAALALKFAAVSFVFNILGNILSSPQLTRLRMDLNASVNAGIRSLGLILVPFELYAGGRIAAAVGVLAVSSILAFLVHLFVSRKFLKGVVGPSISPDLIGPLLRFGGGIVTSGIAVVLLTNADKLILTRLFPIESLGYYSVAFNFAALITFFSQAMTQSLVPAFSQLLEPDKAEFLRGLYSRAFRSSVVLMIPVTVALALMAKPFFCLWAGEEFGRRSVPLFYILCGALFCQAISHVPSALLTAAGKTALMAKIYWSLFIPFILVVYILTSTFGATGAAMSWTFCMSVYTWVIFVLARRATGISVQFPRQNRNDLALAVLSLFASLAVSYVFRDRMAVVCTVLIGFTCLYLYFAWYKLTLAEEKIWLRELISRRILSAFGVPSLPAGGR